MFLFVFGLLLIKNLFFFFYYYKYNLFLLLKSKWKKECLVSQIMIVIMQVSNNKIILTQIGVVILINLDILNEKISKIITEH